MYGSLKIRFNPSQVRFTQKAGLASYSKACKGFNPSQVRFTLLDFYGEGIAGFLFQSLTGSIHTKNVKLDINPDDLFQSLTGSIHT